MNEKSAQGQVFITSGRGSCRVISGNLGSRPPALGTDSYSTRPESKELPRPRTPEPFAVKVPTLVALSGRSLAAGRSGGPRRRAVSNNNSIPGIRSRGASNSARMASSHDSPRSPSAGPITDHQERWPNSTEPHGPSHDHSGLLIPDQNPLPPKVMNRPLILQPHGPGLPRVSLSLLRDWERARRRCDCPPHGLHRLSPPSPRALCRIEPGKLRPCFGLDRRRGASQMAFPRGAWERGCKITRSPCHSFLRSPRNQLPRTFMIMIPLQARYRCAFF